MWGTSSPGDKLTGDFGNRPDATSISDRGLFCLLAGNLSPGVFRLLQHNRHIAAGTDLLNLWSVLGVLRTWMDVSPRPTASLLTRAGHDGTEVPHCSGLPVPMLCYRLAAAQEGVRQRPIWIQNDSGLCQGLAGRSAAG
jgi:hypothetical protein